MDQNNTHESDFTLLNCVPEGIFIIKSDWIVLAWNHCLQNWSGIEATTIIGRSIIDFLPHLEEPKYSDRLKSVFQESLPVIFSSQLHMNIIPCPLPDGSLRILHSIVTPHKVQDKKPAYALFTIQDVTDATQRIQKYDSLNKELKNEILRRQQVENKILNDKMKAQKANDAKSMFLSQLSHEFRTPLNSILGFTQLIMMDTLSPLSKIQRDNLDKVATSGYHLLELINEVLDLAKIEARKIKLTMEPVHLQKVLQEVVSLNQPLAKQMEISLGITCPEKPDIYIYGDYLRIKQILINLISNAIKFNHSKGSVNVTYSNNIKGSIKINVEDTGVGISSEDIPRLFTPFERFKAENSSISGTGIGLTIAHKLAKAMEGSLDTTSILGKGSTFSLSLPVAFDPQEGNTSEKPSYNPVENIKMTKKKILYIEDIKANIELVKQILKARPHCLFRHAVNGTSGIELALNDVPDLILMDINMPGIDGLTAFKNLSEHPKTKLIPVIAISADAMESDIKHAMDLGFHSYITKPIDVNNFLKIIDDTLA